MPTPISSPESLAAALARSYPELAAVRAAADDPVYLVGGAVRDLLLGLPRSDIDLVVEGDAAALAERLGAEAMTNSRFGTAKVRLDGHELDIAAARSETYASPGALPDVRPGADLATDLGRRDFTINAMAIPLTGEAALVDPHGGRGDLEAGVLRVLHDRSFADDPTRALRAARYAARFGLTLDPDTERLLRAADLTTVSADRQRAELERLAAEASGPRGLRLLAEWRLVRLRDGGAQLAERVAELLQTPLWSEVADRPNAVLAAAIGPERGEAELAMAEPGSPSEAVDVARGHDGVEMALARALGAGWLDRYLAEWRSVRLEIDGADLIAAGVPEGPAVGGGLAAALRQKLDGELRGREQELAAALAAAGRGR